MANIINDPAFKKKLEQMTPQVPPLSGEVELPNLGQIAQQTAQQVLPQQPLVSEQQSRAESIREGAMDIGRGILSTVGQGVRNIAQAPGAAADVLFDPSRPSMSDVMSERGMRTVFGGGDAVIPQAPPEGVFTPREQVLGEATRPPAQLGQTARGTMGIEPQAPVSAQVAPPAAAQPQAPQAGSGGLISFDTGARAGQTFFGDETGVGAVSQQNAAQIGRGFDETYGQRSYGDISITGPSGQPIDPNSTRYDASRLTPEMQENVQAGRPPNVSAAQVGQAQQEAVARQADYEQRQVNNRIDSQMRQWERDNPRATEKAAAMQRQQLMQQEALVQKPSSEGGLAGSDRDIPAGQVAKPPQSKFQAKVAEQMIPAMNEWNQGGNSRAKANIDKLSGVAQDLRDKNLDTRTVIDLLPVASDWARKLVNPSGSDAVDRIRGVAYQSLREILGAQFTEKEGKNLVDTYFNPAMDEDTNAERLEDFVATLSAAYNAKNSMFEYLSENESMVGYNAQDAEDVVRRALGGGGGAGGSPIKGDVNISQEVDSRLQNYKS